jgi:hypothetical protein
MLDILLASPYLAPQCQRASHRPRHIVQFSQKKDDIAANIRSQCMHTTLLRDRLIPSEKVLQTTSLHHNLLSESGASPEHGLSTSLGS